MAVNRKRFVTRSEYAEENKRLTKINKIGKYLNLYIVAVAALTVIILAATIAMSGNEEVAPTKEPEQQEIPTPTEPTAEEPVVEEAPEEPVGENQIVTVDDPVVQEVQTNAAWPVHPTTQTGRHVSTFEKGHIDYEEKLAAIFSVTDLVQEESFVKKVGNNGSASNAIAVVTSKDGSKIYRVSIEWMDGAGWKPVKLEVLKTLEGAY